MTTANFAALSNPCPHEFSGWRVMANTRIGAGGAFSRAVQAVEFPGGRWRWSASWRAMADPDRGIFDAWIANLGGQATWFWAYDWSRPTPRGAAKTQPGTPVVSAPNQVGKVLTLSGCPSSVAGWLLPGDLFGVAGEVKQVTAIVNTTVGGGATVQFAPPLRMTPVLAAPITLVKPVGQFALLSNESGPAGMQPSPAGPRSDYALDAIEVWAP